MKLIYHCAMCCAIRHIYGFGENPSGKLCKYTPKEKEGDEPDLRGTHVNSNWEMPYGERPEETYLERLVFFLEYLKKKRPSGLVEVCLARLPCGYGEKVEELYHWDNEWTDGEKLKWCEEECDQRLWFPVLLELGFREVAQLVNSNSDNIVHVFHLIMQNGEIV
jgi:hypothetical protein